MTMTMVVIQIRSLKLRVASRGSRMIHQPINNNKNTAGFQAPDHLREKADPIANVMKGHSHDNSISLEKVRPVDDSTATADVQQVTLHSMHALGGYAQLASESIVKLYHSIGDIDAADDVGVVEQCRGHDAEAAGVIEQLHRCLWGSRLGDLDPVDVRFQEVFHLGRNLAGPVL